MQSNEATAVVTDLARTNDLGFLGDPNLGSPLSTRANILQFYIVSDKVWKNNKISYRSQRIY
jgi:hypothetical protein